MLKTKCPNCNKSLSFPEEYLGRRIKCPACKNVLIAETIKEKPSIPPPTPSTSPQINDSYRDNTLPTSTSNNKNIILRAWSNSPAAFRNAFLATLGVIAALLLVWQVFGLKSKFDHSKNKNEEQTITNHYSYPSENVHDTPSTISDTRNHTPLSMKQSNGTEKDFMRIDNLAASILLLNKCGELHLIQRIRVRAYTRFMENYNIESLINVLECTKSELDELYILAKKYNIPSEKQMQATYQNLLSAIDAEYSFQKAIIDFAGKPGNTRLADNAKKTGEKAVQLMDQATISAVLMLGTIDPELVKSYSEVTGTSN